MKQRPASQSWSLFFQKSFQKCFPSFSPTAALFFSPQTAGKKTQFPTFSMGTFVKLLFMGKQSWAI